MRILILHKHTNISGVSTFIKTVGLRLSGLGHDVKLHIPGTKCRSFLGLDAVSVINNEYDQIIINYDSQFKLVEAVSGIKKFFVHGLMHDEFIPKHKYDVIYSFGERAMNYVRADVMIRNPIDTKFFCPYKRPRRTLDRILILDYRNGFALLPVLKAAISHINPDIRIRLVSDYSKSREFDVREAIDDSDAVVAMGRSMFEAMSMGRPVINFGVFGGDGYVTNDNFGFMLKTNGSGWSSKPKVLKGISDWDFKSLSGQLSMYNASDGDNNRSLILSNMDLDLHINTILS